MRLWTIQPICIYDLLKAGQIYRCKAGLCENLTDSQFAKAYTWLAGQMRTRIGPPPEHTAFPAWAWHTVNWQHKRPDMRRSEFRGFEDAHVLMELEIPDDDILLSDYDTWHIVLNNGYYGDATDEASYDKEMAWFDALPMDKQKKLREKSWEKVFDTTKIDTEWAKNGRYVQATFWEIRPEHVMKAWKYQGKIRP